MMRSSKFLMGYTHRGKNVDWYTIYKEYLDGTGPERILITEFDNPIIQAIIASPQFRDAKRELKFSGMDGDLVVIMGADSKSKSSYSPNPYDGEEVNVPRIRGIGFSQTTIYRTYLWIMPKSTFK